MVCRTFYEMPVVNLAPSGSLVALSELERVDVFLSL